MKNFSFIDGMRKIPGGMMIIPLLLGSILRTFFPGFLDLGSLLRRCLKMERYPSSRY
jgi:2-keto-3-deoxygluconate permease